MREQVPDDDPDMRFFGPPHPGERLLSEMAEPVAGMKVRYVLRVVSGERARQIDIRQAQVIMEVMQWLRDHPGQHQQPDPGREETTR
jgi:hypothetical protein